MLENNFEKNILAFETDCTTYNCSHNSNEYHHFKKIKMN